GNSNDARYESFVGLVARHDRQVRSYIRSLMITGDGVDDVFQETMLECWKKFASFELSSGEEGGFGRWACAIARFKVLRRRRDAARDRLEFSDALFDQLAEEALDQLPHYKAQRRAIERCLSKMDASSQRLLLSIYRSGESVAKIAKETGEQTRRLYHRLENLRKGLLDCVTKQLLEGG
ncbi:MAG: sigma-70 family RNA polymerase sigma factor, partial [Planctomycetota bacterium]